MTDEAIARREAEAAFESWPRSQGINESVAAWGRRAFLAGYLSRHQSDRERIEALEAALRKLSDALSKLNILQIEVWARDEKTMAQADKWIMRQRKIACAALAAETQEQRG